jgi:hypothetical protein
MEIYYMRVIIAGSRNIVDYNLVEVAIFQSDFLITEVVSGGARGPDSLGEAWASENGIPCAMFGANWGRFGKAAGMYRNADMADYCDAGIILWDGESRGALDMIDKLRRLGKPVEVWMWDGEGFIYVA